MAVLATFARLYVEDLDLALDALAAAGLTNVRLRFVHRAGLQLALVNDVLVLAGKRKLLDEFRSTDVTVIVDDLDVAWP